MSPRNDRNTGVILALAAVVVVLFNATGIWDTLNEHTPMWAHPFLGSPALAVILLFTAIYFLWRAANSAEAMQQAAEAMKKGADEALRLAHESNLALQRRIEAAEAKLTRAIDEQVIDWAPARQRLEEEAEQRVRQVFDGWMEQLRQVYQSYHRRATRGYGPDDDLNGPPSIDTGNGPFS